MNPDTIKAATEALKPLLDKLGELGAHGWELAVRQQYVYAITNTLLLVLAVCVCAALGSFLRKRIAAWEKPNYCIWDHYCQTGEGMLLTIAFCVLLVATVVGIFVGLGPIVGRFVNPEWYAIQSLVGLVK